MAQKVYWKGLTLVLQRTARYGAKWDTQLSHSLTTPQYNCFRDVMTAIASCLALLPQNTPVE
jgi:hypothetical protein